MNSEKGSSIKKYAYIFLILALTFIVYRPALKAGFTNWDDDHYVTKNEDITSFEKHKENLLTKVYAGNYHPLTMLSLTVDYAIGKNNPKVYHRTNLLLHLANSVLVFIFIYLLLRNSEAAFIAGILFGVHPLQTESVAWISERKNVLYAFFFLAALITYIQYLKKEKIWLYLLALLFFIFSLFSKGLAVTLSVLIVAIDLLLNRKLTDRKVILEKIPFFCLSLIVGLIAIEAQPLGSEIDASRTTPAQNPFHEKILYGVYNFGIYILNLIIPYKQATFYPYPTKVAGILPMMYYIIPVLIVVLTSLLIYWILKKKIYQWNYILFGLIFFSANIALVLQFFPVGDAIRADRYVYIPSIGIFLLIGILFQYITDVKPRWKYIAIGFLSVYMIFLSNIAYSRCNVWKNSVTLWTDEVKKFPKLAMAYNNRGIARDENGDREGAIEDYKKCLELDPKFYKAYNNRGILESIKGNFPAAIADFSKCLELDPDYANAYLNRARAFYSSGNYSEAINDCSRYFKHDTLNYQAYLLSGLAKIHAQKYQEAISDLTKACDLDPDNPEIYSNRGVARSIISDFSNADTDFSKAIELAPSFNAAYYNRAKARLSLGRNKEACEDFKMALEYGHLKASENLSKYCN